MANNEAIDEATSKRICTHMNEDHAASVHGMVLNTVSAGNISECKMKSISLEGVKLSYVVCSGDMCDMKTTYMVFDPPLKSVKESR